jgi:hypothetical protein
VTVTFSIGPPVFAGAVSCAKLGTAESAVLAKSAAVKPMRRRAPFMYVRAITAP